MSTSFETARAEALFASYAQPSDQLTNDQIRTAVAQTISRLHVGGCAAYVAGEYGDHPETAIARMSWALATVRSVYPARPPMTRMLHRSRCLKLVS